ncbi:hypothetical protein SIN8267_03457 [Sinobacterium norvegicum]|uniref:Polysaccharide biosynthesis protein n=2 Tax=Sinobacterium norvegicum TaxID=1641715 RepID=A0ABN8EPL1_9GAMM|nr:hypothetical protein SIN8267_03457 [Sinobacterium norvegicum]
MLVNLAGVAVGFLLQLFLTNSLPIDVYGTYAFYVSLTGFSVVVAKFGSDLSANRYLPSIIESDNLKLFNHFNLRAVILVALMSLLISLLYALLQYIGSSSLVEISFLVFFLIIILFSVSQYFCAVIQAIGLSIYSQSILNVCRPIIFLGMVLISVNIYSDSDISSVMTMYGISSGVCIIIASVIIYKNLPQGAGSLLNVDKRVDFSTWLKTSASLSLVVFLNLIVNQFDLLYLGISGSAIDVAKYNVMLRVSTFVQFPTVAAGLVLAPKIALAWDKGERKKLEQLISTIVAPAFALCVLIALAIIFFSEEIFQLFGGEYSINNSDLVIVISARLINAIGGISGYIMTMTGNHKDAIKVLVVASLVSISFSSLLIPEFGIEGAVYVNLAASMCWVLMMSYFVVVRTGISPIFLIRKVKT